MRIFVSLLISVAWALPAIAQPDETAKHYHVFPHVADGGGWQSSLVVTNAGQSSNSCTLQLQGLTVDRFEESEGVMAEGSMAAFDLTESGSHLVWRTRNEEMALATGYATLDCAAPVTAQVVFAQTNSMGEPTGIATVFSAQPGFVFRFPILKQDATLAFAIANDTDTEAHCDLALVDLQGGDLGHTHLDVPSMSNHAQVLNSSIPIPDDFSGGSATVSCNQQVAAIGIHSENQPDGVNITFSTLPPTIRPTTQFENTDGLWDGTWKDVLILTLVHPGFPPPLPECSGLVGCMGANYPLTAELMQSGDMVSGSLKTTVLERDMEWMVTGVVSDDGTLSLSSEDELTVIFSDASPPVQVRLKSWESRQDVLGAMTGTVGVGMYLQGMEIVGITGCLGNKTLADTASSDVSMLSSACSGLRRSNQ